MRKHGNKISRNILLPPELDQYIAGRAQEEVRTYNEQLEYMLTRSRRMVSAEGTQLDVVALKDSSLLAKVQ